MRLLAPALALALCLGADRLAAQVAGRVVDAPGRPVAEATVELWSSLRKVAQARTDAEGRFAFAAEEARGVTGVRVHRFGYQAASRALGGPAADLVVRLDPLPIALEGVRATAPRRVCPSREDPRARELWERVRARYEVPEVLPPIRLATERYEARGVRFGEIGRVDTIRPRPGVFSTPGEPGDGRLEGRYARRAVVGGREGWEYAPLAWGFNQHFVGPAFATLHTFAFRGRPGAAGAVLAFCPRGRREPDVEGTLMIGPDTTLRRARWRYRTPPPDAEAGGEAEYLPPSITTRSLLFPDRSLFWRRRGRTTYYFREDRYREGRIGEAAASAAP